MDTSNAPAIVLLGQTGLPIARRIQALYPRARILGLAQRVQEADEHYSDFGQTLRKLYRDATPIIALCAAGIVIRSLAPLLAGKGAEPPVLALAEDGSAVVPLLGGLGGVNRLAREIAATLEVAPAITTSGELRFGTCLLDPPAGYALSDIEQGKRFVADLLGGEPVRVQGVAPWLETARLPLASQARRVIHISAEQRPPAPDELLIHPRAIVALLEGAASIENVRGALAEAGLSPLSLACLLAEPERMTDASLLACANELGVPLRFLIAGQALPPLYRHIGDVYLHCGAEPVNPACIGQPRGRLTVLGLGPGASELMVPAARRALDEAQDLLGYETYLSMVGPLRPDQTLHGTDNREELQRARHAFELAASGRRVVVVSSGDPGVFAMAAAVLQALDESRAPDWQRVQLQVLPGVSAALATAAKAGAPLGHDFCMLSLSDNLKPWEVIEQRLDHAAAADLAMALYNPISKARPWQLGRALEIIARHREPDTVVVLGRDIGRPDERLTLTHLGQLRTEQVDMRTLVIIGSSLTRRIPKGDGDEWVYTPRWYR